ncbi:hypothetical protein ACU4GD_43700 [Cupriavidus basilensis]
MPRLRDFDHLLVMRTVSKLGLAGIRAGYVAGRPEWLAADGQGAPAVQRQCADRGHRPMFVLEHVDVLDQQAAQLRAERASRGRCTWRAQPGRARCLPERGQFHLLVAWPIPLAALFEARAQCARRF